MAARGASVVSGRYSATVAAGRERAVARSECAAREHDQRGDEDPLRPEVAVGAGEEPDEDRDDVDDPVLERQRAPAPVAGVDARELRRRQLPQRVPQLRLGARGLRLVQPLLELVEREPAGLITRRSHVQILPRYSKGPGDGDFLFSTA